MKSENILLWAKELGTTDKNQGVGMLHQVSRFGQRIVDEFCCMGLGCNVAGIEASSPVNDPLWDEGDLYEEAVHYMGMDQMPPVEFHEWLGLPTPEQLDPGSADYDIYLDVPDDLETRYHPERGVPRGQDIAAVGLSVMNDQWRLTFAQIGDLIRYFGVTNNVGGATSTSREENE